MNLPRKRRDIPVYTLAFIILLAAGLGLMAALELLTPEPAVPFNEIQLPTLGVEP